MIYAFNGLNERIELWKVLKEISTSCTDPWLLLGDFSVVLSPIKRLGGNSSDAEMQHFQDCISIYGMEDIPATRALFTWSNKREPADKVYSRLDRAMGNQEWLDAYCDSVAHFHPKGLFDHCHLLLWKKIQKDLILNPGDVDLLQQEMDLAKDLRDLILARDSFFIQKAKVQWSLEGNVIQTAFLEYYQELLGSHTNTDTVNNNVVRRGPCCNESHWAILASLDVWDVVGEEVCGVILNFFDIGKLLTQINATIITLIPKIDRPTSVKHFRPISCCNVIYKAISKIMCTRLALILPDIINRSQGAFKAYDLIEWSFVDQMLVALKFSEMLMTCISTNSYTLNLNGAHF
ncbi:uncharacterized protein LOC141613383 [Silene latifolia]|uniref:uncharacterized protein LOC141613383 n=1 Tax=Silene latifolia TaxID=37657 RepID=UPI003D782BED